MKTYQYKPTGELEFKTIEAQAKEIKDRLLYFCGKTDGSYTWLSPLEAQLLPLVLELVEKINEKEGEELVK